jgi:ATP phosphoribosyltransferase regulatory subunit
MTEIADKSLLPAGLRDVLPPDAAFEADSVDRLVDRFVAHGYERVKPPLLEFEDALLAGPGAAVGGQTFRLMDPDSRRMMALRPDMTLQVARIASTRLKSRPRPLRLSYSGQVLRVKGTQLRPERQFGQVGAELIGAETAAADAEVVLMGIEALTDAGVKRLSVDIGMPTLVPALFSGRVLEPALMARLRLALDRKDAAAVTALGPALAPLQAKGPGGDLGVTLAALLAAAGPAVESLALLERLALPPPAAALRAELGEVVRRVADDLAALAIEGVSLTVDPVENRGFDYHTGVSFTFFAGGVRGELGSGGRYRTGNGSNGGELATGLTFFTDTLLAAWPRPETRRRVYLPLGVQPAAARRLRQEGWITVAALGADADPAAAARAMGCTHVWDTRAAAPVATRKP